MRTVHLAHVVLGAFILAGQPGPAKADFRLSSGSSGERMPGPQPADGSVPLASQAKPPVQRIPAAPRFQVAQGFGRAVSLGFAARQIVPPAVTVRFGAGVDPASPVDWSGGQPWNRVLAAAVQPLGLRIVAGASSVLILR